MGQQEEIQLSTEDAFAVYSLPGTTDHILVRGQIENNLSPTGAFILQRFDKKGERPLFLTAQEVVYNAIFSFDVAHDCSQVETPKRDYLHYVEATIESITEGHFRKVVLSRIKNVKRETQDLFDLFVSLKSTYPNAFVFIYNIPDGGCWCGASPEILLEKGKNGYQTMALAGTQLDKDVDLSEVVWGNKEIHEQRIIEEFIVSILTFEKISYNKMGPSTFKAGQVLHILTTFESESVPDPLLLADLLHPGPAICGLPQSESLDWIKKNEGYDRSFYCGYIGPWDIDGRQSLFINLRSMQIYADVFSLYLGGGITVDSEAGSEWHETELKARTLISVIDKLITV